MFRWFKNTPELERLLIKNSPVVNKTHLKKKLIKQGYLDNSCKHCGIGPQWQGKSLTLEMDHINGDNRDNRLENLRILCLNCHAQTPTFRRRKVVKKQSTMFHYFIPIAVVGGIVLCSMFFL